MRCSKCGLHHAPEDTARCANALRLAIVLANTGAIWNRRATEPADTIESAVVRACEEQDNV